MERGKRIRKRWNLTFGRKAEVWIRNLLKAEPKFRNNKSKYIEYLLEKEHFKLVDDPEIYLVSKVVYHNNKSEDENQLAKYFHHRLSEWRKKNKK